MYETPFCLVGNHGGGIFLIASSRYLGECGDYLTFYVIVVFDMIDSRIGSLLDGFSFVGSFFVES